MMSRRRFLAVSGASAAGLGLSMRTRANTGAPAKTARIAITFDLEMSRNFPAWDQTHWDFEKGNLDEDTKRYSLVAARKVKAAGGRMHFFAVGRVFEQENIDWLKEIIAAGHAVGNHTYDHVHMKASRIEDLQFRFQRAPWLVEGKTPAQVIEENVRLTELAMKARLEIAPVGFRTPGGFPDGLDDRPDLQKLLLAHGYKWVSSKYPAHSVGPQGTEPGDAILGEILKAQVAAQPYRYPSGLIEIPMSPPSDITVFRGGKWKLEWFLRAVRLGLEWAIECGGVFDFLGHPSCLSVTDPELKTLDLICDLVRKAGNRAELVTLEDVARGSLPG